MFTANSNVQDSEIGISNYLQYDSDNDTDRPRFSAAEKGKQAVASWNSASGEGFVKTPTPLSARVGSFLLLIYPLPMTLPDPP